MFFSKADLTYMTARSARIGFVALIATAMTAGVAAKQSQRLTGDACAIATSHVIAV